VTTTYTSSTLPTPVDGLPLTTYAWPDPVELRGVVQISHGLAEHAARYDRLAAALISAGFAVRSHDHRGHGASVGNGVSLGSFGEAGWDGLVADLVTVSRAVGAEHPELPLFLIGHSMGSFALQQAIVDYSELYRGVVLSGTTALDVMAAAMAENLQPDDEPGELSSFNAGFEHRTGYEWLSRDQAEVDLYVADPLCGFPTEPDVLPQIFGSNAPRLADPVVLSRIRSDLPILVTSGDADPLSGGGQLVELVGRRYREAGVTDVTVKLYPQARHEIFNETNREEVTADVIDWLLDHI